MRARLSDLSIWPACTSDHLLAGMVRVVSSSHLKPCGSDRSISSRALFVSPVGCCLCHIRGRLRLWAIRSAPTVDTRPDGPLPHRLAVHLLLHDHRAESRLAGSGAILAHCPGSATSESENATIAWEYCFGILVKRGAIQAYWMSLTEFWKLVLHFAAGLTGT